MLGMHKTNDQNRWWGRDVKIGLTGTHASGKTTYAKELADHYDDLSKTTYMVHEVARNCPFELGTVDAQEYIWEHQMMQEKHAMAQDVDVIICDRTVMDNLMYYRYIIDYDHVAIENYCKTAVRWWELLDEARAWMPTYDHVIRMPLNLEHLKADDPIRPKSEEYARRIDDMFDEFVQPYVTCGFEEI